MLPLPSCTYTGNPSILNAVDQESMTLVRENGGGVWKAGTPVSEGGEDERRKERHIQCIIGNG